ncbi:MAG: bifunctional pyr operon transcriptional regulator/uracil phosphoribosyltransferase PyrR [Acholeplasma sp.]|nr:bifunctional pyr operon transcriptional regulator/uracil phosphoribosyltransferase PyrR [Acholeplasma sp.]
MKEILTKEQIDRTLRRLTHEIIERNNDLSNLIIVGIEKKGTPLANVLKNNLQKFANINVPIFSLDITNYRDDKEEKVSVKHNFNVYNKDVILVDDVLYTGRTARAAMDALIDLGRFKKLELAVLVDRGHRELPIRADYVGKNLPTASNEKVILNYDLMTLFIEKDEEKDDN